MNITLNKDEEPKEVKRVKVMIGENKYYLTESVDGKLNINKISDGDSDELKVFPRYANEIELL